jgi:hypothetical protein
MTNLIIFILLEPPPETACGAPLWGGRAMPAGTGVPAAEYTCIGNRPLSANL